MYIAQVLAPTGEGHVLHCGCFDILSGRAAVFYLFGSDNHFLVLVVDILVSNGPIDVVLAVLSGD